MPSLPPPGHGRERGHRAGEGGGRRNWCGGTPVALQSVYYTWHRRNAAPAVLAGHPVQVRGFSDRLDVHQKGTSFLSRGVGQSVRKKDKTKVVRGGRWAGRRAGRPRPPRAGRPRRPPRTTLVFFFFFSNLFFVPTDPHPATRMRSLSGGRRVCLRNRAPGPGDLLTQRGLRSACARCNVHSGAPPVYRRTSFAAPLPPPLDALSPSRGRGEGERA